MSSCHSLAYALNCARGEVCYPRLPCVLIFPQYVILSVSAHITCTPIHALMSEDFCFNDRFCNLLLVLTLTKMNVMHVIINNVYKLSHFVHCVSKKKQYAWLLVITSANVDRFSKFFSLTNTQENSLCNCSRVFHLTLSMLLHYLVKLENYNCCRFRWRIACETSEFILQHAVINEAHTTEWRKRLQACVRTRYGRFQDFL